LPGPQRLLLAGDAHLDAVARLHGLGEAQRVDAVVGEYRPEGRVDEESGGGGDEEVAMRDPAAEDRVAARRGFIHVSVEMIARELGKALDVRHGHFPFRGIETVADGERTVGNAERMSARVALARALDPAA